MLCSDGEPLPTDDCLIPCKGLYADIKKHDVTFKKEDLYNISMIYYNNYTWMFGPEYKPPFWIKNTWKYNMFGEKKLKFIRIFWDTPIFNKITRSRVGDGFRQIMYSISKMNFLDKDLALKAWDGVFLPVKEVKDTKQELKQKIDSLPADSIPDFAESKAKREFYLATSFLDIYS